MDFGFMVGVVECRWLKRSVFEAEVSAGAKQQQTAKFGQPCLTASSGCGVSASACHAWCPAKGWARSLKAGCRSVNNRRSRRRPRRSRGWSHSSGVEMKLEAGGFEAAEIGVQGGEGKTGADG